ncbi:MAG: ABC transporter substrate-binding protein, partial [Candidatus Rokubacteria bacterium]|nr:ABC transporter substrate-binding protein [Candidatus Rokubacteria bacterium]
DPVGTGDVASLAHPGGNVTGTAQMATDLSVKQLELLRDVVPGAARIGVLWNPTTPSHAPALTATEAAARGLGVQLTRLEARSGDDLERVFASATRERVGALLVLASPWIFLQRARLANLALQHRVPALLASPQFVEAGGLLSYSPNQPDLLRRAAVYVDKILKGAKPADLPVEQPTKFELVVNLRTAKTLGLTLPQSLLLRADRVIE